MNITGVVAVGNTATAGDGGGISVVMSGSVISNAVQVLDGVVATNNTTPQGPLRAVGQTALSCAGAWNNLICQSVLSPALTTMH